MKRLSALSLCVVLVIFTFIISVFASENNTDQIIISQNITYITDDSYFLETISVPAIQPYKSAKTGTKTAVYVTSGTPIFTISVTGKFTYDGSSSVATSASGSISTHVANATIDDRYAYISGSSACAFGSISYDGAILQKTVTLTCDKDGSLS